MKSPVNRFLMTSILVLTMGALLVGCKAKLENHIEQMTISGQIETLLEAGKTSSRAQVSDRVAFVSGDAIGVWVVPYKVTGVPGGVADVATALRGINNYKDNVKYTSTVGSGFTGEVIYYPNATVKVDVYAVAPYVLAMDNMGTDPKKFAFSVKQNQATAGGVDVIASDFLTAKATGQSATPSGTVALEFSHRLTRVLVGFNLPTKYKDATVTGVAKVELLGMKLKAVIDVSDKSVSAIPSTEANVDLDISMFQAEVTAANKVVYEAIIVPGKVVNLDDNVVKISLNVEGFGVVEFIAQSAGVVDAASVPYTYLANTQYNITTNLGDQTEVKLNTITIAEWGSEIVVEANTTKLHTMKFTCVKGVADNDVINMTAKKATIIIQGVTYENCEVTYDGDATAGVYTVKYDVEGNFGGYLSSFQFNNADGDGLFGVSTGFNKQVKGNPADDNYDEKIGKITFSTSSITFE